MKLESKNLCPLNSFEPCRQLDCAWFMKVAGKNPQTNEEIDEHGCAVGWMPVLLINSAREQHNTAAAVESFRNEMVKNNEVGQKLLLATALSNSHSQEPKLINGINE